MFIFQEKSKVIGPGNGGANASAGRTILLGTELEKSGLPQATVDLSNGANNATVISAKGLELSTLV